MNLCKLLKRKLIFHIIYIIFWSLSFFLIAQFAVQNNNNAVIEGTNYYNLYSWAYYFNMALGCTYLAELVTDYVFWKFLSNTKLTFFLDTTCDDITTLKNLMFIKKMKDKQYILDEESYIDLKKVKLALILWFACEYILIFLAVCFIISSIGLAQTILDSQDIINYLAINQFISRLFLYLSEFLFISIMFLIVNINKLTGKPIFYFNSIDSMINFIKNKNVIKEITQTKILPILIGSLLFGISLTTLFQTAGAFLNNLEWVSILTIFVILFIVLAYPYIDHYLSFRYKNSLNKTLTLKDIDLIKIS